jgi:two-component system KDP operon response regulator KdpE
VSEKPTILVVDDERQIQLFLRLSLEAAGYQVRIAGSARAALDSFVAGSPDLVILDLGLPDLDGKTVIGQIRQTSDVPVIVLSARGAEGEKIDSLDLGANDFVQKPFGIGELLARIRAALRTRIAISDGDVLSLANVTIDVTAHTVTRDGAPVHLTPKEFELLTLLARHPGRVLTHRQILAKVWGPAHVEDVAYLRVLIGQLRQKIEPVPAEPRLILTETGIGYRVCGPDAVTA